VTIEEAYRKLPEYLEGGLPPRDREDIERWLLEDPELLMARDISLRLESSLHAQPWIKPSPASPGTS